MVEIDNRNAGHFVSTSFLETVIGLVVVAILVAIVVYKNDLSLPSVELDPKGELRLSIAVAAVTIGVLALVAWKNRG